MMGKAITKKSDYDIAYLMFGCGTVKHISINNGLIKLVNLKLGMVPVEEIQNSLSRVTVYVRTKEGKAPKLVEIIAKELQRLGFTMFLRAEGYAFFPKSVLKPLVFPNIRLMINHDTIVIRVHMSSALTGERASIAGTTVEGAYDEMMKGLDKVVELIRSNMFIVKEAIVEGI